MVITETRRVDTTWIIDGELTDRSVLSDELAQFCAKYRIYHVKKTPDSSIATRIEKEGKTTSVADPEVLKKGEGGGGGGGGGAK